MKMDIKNPRLEAVGDFYWSFRSEYDLQEDPKSGELAELLEVFIVFVECVHSSSPFTKFSYGVGVNSTIYIYRRRTSCDIACFLNFLLKKIYYYNFAW